MNRADFDALVTETVKVTSELLIAKGAEYADDTERLANFKRSAEKNGQTVLEAWQTYWGKHVDSINSYMARVKDKATYLALQEVVLDFEKTHAMLPLPQRSSISDKAKMMKAVIDPQRFRNRLNTFLPDAMREVDRELSEGIEGRFHDNINYSFLGLAIIKEVRESTGGEPTGGGCGVLPRR